MKIDTHRMLPASRPLPLLHDHVLVIAHHEQRRVLVGDRARMPGQQPQEAPDRVLGKVQLRAVARGHLPRLLLEVAYEEVLSARLLLALSEECNPGASNDRAAYRLPQERPEVRLRPLLALRKQLLCSDFWRQRYE